MELMSGLQVTAFITVVVLLESGSAALNGTGETFPLCYMNITSDRHSVGFVQLLAYAGPNTRMRVTATVENLDRFSFIGEVMEQTFNLTEDYYVNHMVAPNGISGVDNLGVVVSSSDDIFVIGVKSDQGSTDAFLALPIMRASLEFFIAGWPYNDPFFASIQIIAARNDTCVEIYKVFDGNTFVLLDSASLNQFDAMRYFVQAYVNKDGSTNPDVDGDATGYYVNATNPIQVISGHECANVPSESVFYCDHLDEQIPPINQLGTVHVVAPIIGRAKQAGYIVRVVSTEMGTVVTATGSSVINPGSNVINRGAYIQIDTTDASVPILVTCSKRCLVMQYNKGNQFIRNDVPTDPFMTLVVPADRFTRTSGFATPSYCDDSKIRQDFNNFFSVVTYVGYKDFIVLDGQPLNKTFGFKGWDTSLPGFAVATCNLSHDFHYMEVSKDKIGSFALYVYGHSVMETSTSAYGFSANYNITGDSVTENWEESVDDFNDFVINQSIPTCTKESQLTGAIVSGSEYATFPLQMVADMKPVTLSSSCLSQYSNLLTNQLQNLTRIINFWICTTQNCSYLNGFGVALDYSTLSTTFIKNSQGLYNQILVTINMISSLSTQSVNFAKCRLEVQSFLAPFAHWPKTNDLMTLGKAGSCSTSLAFLKPQWHPPLQSFDNCPAVY